MSAPEDERLVLVERRIAVLQGHVIALTHYLRASLDKHPNAHEAIAMAERELEGMTATLLNSQFPDALFDGIALTRKQFRVSEKGDSHP